MDEYWVKFDSLSQGLRFFHPLDNPRSGYKLFLLREFRHRRLDEFWDHSLPVPRLAQWFDNPNC